MTKAFFNNVPAPSELVRLFSPRNFCIYSLASVGLAFSVHAQQPPSPQIKSQSQPDAIVSEQNSMLADDDNNALADVYPYALTEKPQSATDWMLKMSAAVRTLNFEVSFVVSRLNQETVPFLWRHGVLNDGTSVEQLNLQNGPGRELIRFGDVVSIFEPDAPPYSLQSKYINGPIPSELLYDPMSLVKGYDFVSVGRARVAGRPAQQLRVVSRDNTRFSYQLWLDQQSGMLLKMNTLDLQGNVLEQIQVSSFEIHQQAPEYFAKVNRDSLPAALALHSAANRAQNWEVDYLPSGMVEVKQDIRRLAVTGQVVEYKLFSDGLVDVSVYVQPAADAIGSDLVLRHELSTFLSLTDGKAQVTVIGEIPLQTANAIATSLKLKDDNGD
ncbi:MucB/RseB C-terminal domain-containing protein [Alteromonas confluentis]|uniref:Sigma-E factor regulatory protein RseB n=1 Tax=Alteromonas confluentis TaxID=1656094 RepID=A0A1E7Z7M9_9ALTE|nr:MucB/RseB C-terminal domain-containing protein [Alteromonas confluentis]OFC69538.1 sigma-E factor regulatory protein RseB [Alteromonas confluentis]